MCDLARDEKVARLLGWFEKGLLFRREGSTGSELPEMWFESEAVVFI